MISKILKVTILAISIFCCGINVRAQNIMAQTFYKHDKYLSSDKLQGRFPGTKGNNDAAAYIKKYFKQYGLKKFGDSYYQPFKLFVKEGINKMKSDTVATQNVVGYLEGSDQNLKN